MGLKTYMGVYKDTMLGILADIVECIAMADEL